MNRAFTATELFLCSPCGRYPCEECDALLEREEIIDIGHALVCADCADIWDQDFTGCDENYERRQMGIE